MDVKFFLCPEYNLSSISTTDQDVAIVRKRYNLSNAEKIVVEENERVVLGIPHDHLAC